MSNNNGLTRERKEIMHLTQQVRQLRQAVYENLVLVNHLIKSSPDKTFKLYKEVLKAEGSPQPVHSEICNDHDGWGEYIKMTLKEDEKETTKIIIPR